MIKRTNGSKLSRTKLNLEKEILKEHTKTNTIRLVKYIGNDEDRFAELINLFFSNKHLVSQYAAWILSYSAKANPELLKPYLKKLLKNLKNPNMHGAIERNTMRMLQHIEVPSNLLGELSNICFSYIKNPTKAIAVRAFSMTVLFNIVKREPGLRNEFLLVLKSLMPEESAGIKARARIVLRFDFAQRPH